MVRRIPGGKTRKCLAYFVKALEDALVNVYRRRSLVQGLPSITGGSPVPPTRASLLTITAKLDPY